MTYLEEFRRSIAEPLLFWREQADKVAWYKRPTNILSDQNGQAQWFADGELNTCYLALDYHVEHGRANQTALIYDSPVTSSVMKYTYLELRDAVAKFAGVLVSKGVGQGDRVIIYLPMIPEAAIAMLACARIGAIHVVVFGGFAAKELATRIDDAKPKAILSASCGIEVKSVIAYKPLVDEARIIAEHKVDVSIVFQREALKADLASGELDWEVAVDGAEPADCVKLKATDPLYILYTSGTTGQPKGVVRDNGGHAVALAYSMRAVYNVAPGDVFWAASDVGWVVGHSYIVYAPLMRGCTTVLFEGKPVRTPDAGTFWRVIESHKVNVLFTAPTGFRAIRKEDPDSALLEKYDISSLRTLFVAGERTDPPTYHWLKKILKVPVIDHWWQTETGWPIASVLMGIEERDTKAGSASFRVPGFNVQILSDDGEVLSAGKEGDVVVALPMPPGCLTTIWGDHERYAEAYLSQHAGYYHTGDGGFIDEDGYLFIMGRTDDVINVAGHRLSTGEMEEIVASHDAVAECAVIGIEDADKGQLPLGLILLKNGVEISEQTLEAELTALMRAQIGAFANYKHSIVVPRLPKTRSGKILRQVMRKIADDKTYTMPATIDDPIILEEIEAAFLRKRIGYISINRA